MRHACAPALCRARRFQEGSHESQNPGGSRSRWLPGCSQRSRHRAHAADLPTFKLEMNDGKLNPARIEVPAGQRIKIEVHNIGKGAAEFESVAVAQGKSAGAGRGFVRRDRAARPGRIQVLRRFSSDGARRDRREVMAWRARGRSTRSRVQSSNGWRFLMGQVLFIVWRESVEALLVVGILYAWLKNGDHHARRGLPYLWVGVGDRAARRGRARRRAGRLHGSALRRRAGLLPDRDGAGRVRADRADGAVDEAPRPHAQARHGSVAAKEHAGRRTGGASRCWSRWRSRAKAARRLCSSTASASASRVTWTPSQILAVIIGLGARVPDVLRAATGRQDLLVAALFPRHRNHAAVPRARVCSRPASTS